jgi:hypothetical protein
MSVFSRFGASALKRGGDCFFVYPKTRSRVSNGSKLAIAVDGRTVWARRYRDILRAFTEALGGAPSEFEKTLLRSAATAPGREWPGASGPGIFLTI